MVALERHAIADFVKIVALLLAPATCMWLALQAGRISRFAVRGWRRLRPRAAAPEGPPVERIAADIRRIARQIESLPPQAPRARREGVILAYDDALGSACTAVGLVDPLRGLPFGPWRDAIRVGVEAELECAGFVMTPDRAA